MASNWSSMCFPRARVAEWPVSGSITPIAEATDRGIRVGDAYAVVEAKHSDIVFRQEGRLLLCADGTKYFFTESGFLDGIGVVTAEVDPLMKAYGAPR